MTAPADRKGRGRRVILWRHGQTAWNVERRFQGTTDVELTETGVGQARRAARLLASLQPDAIVASDLRRAANTAAELAALTGLEVAHDEGLRETYAGVWQGLTHEEIIARHGEEYAAWKRGEPVRRGGGELETEVADRAAPVVLRHAEKLPRTAPLSWSATAARSAPPSAGCSVWTPGTGRASAASPTAAGPSSARAPAAGASWSTMPAPSRSRCSATTTEGSGADFTSGRSQAKVLLVRPPSGKNTRGYSSVGRAPAWHAGGQEFNSP